MALTNIIVNAFPGGFNWPLFVAIQKRFFEQHGVAVTLVSTKSSSAQMTGLAEGAFDIAMTAFDNVVAYSEGQGEAPIGAQPGFFAFMGSDDGFLSLVAAPDISTFADFNGRTLSVDARASGYAFVLFDLLARNGLMADKDYTVERAGGMAERWAALLANRHAGTLLSTPYDLIAVERGFHQLTRAAAAIGAYQGNVAATRRSYAERHQAVLVAFIRGYTDAIEWLYAKPNREEATAILQRTIALSPDIASQTYDECLGGSGGFFRQGRISAEGASNVIELRRRYAGLNTEPSDFAKYYDPAYCSLAIRAPI